MNERRYATSSEPCPHGIRSPNLCWVCESEMTKKSAPSEMTPTEEAAIENGAGRPATPAENMECLYARLNERMSPAEKRELQEVISILRASPSAGGEHWKEEITRRIVQAWDDGKTFEYCMSVLNGIPSSVADIEARAFGEGVLAAAKEVESHWNDSTTMVNQRDQALRSADVLRRLPLARSATTLTMPKADEVLLACGEMDRDELACAMSALKWFITKTNAADSRGNDG